MPAPVLEHTGVGPHGVEAPRPVGRHYTPEWVVRRMLDGCLPAAPPRTFRILDPACGDGAFLVAAFRRLIGDRRRTARGRLGLVRDHLFGVDVDGAAVERLRGRLRDLIEPGKRLRLEADRILAVNFRAGDALTGSGFRQAAATARDAEGGDGAVDWGQAFPQVAAGGGFDLVVGNPPYLRERGARELFERVARSPLGRWREARMDFWHYFAHRGLDLLRPGGRLAFIVNSYWLTATGARRLRSRLERETAVEEIIHLGGRPVFRGVSGRHMILRVRKRDCDEPCTVVDWEAGGELEGSSAVPRRVVPPSAAVRDGDPVSRLPESVVSWVKGGSFLGDLHTVRQGIAENPPVISPRAARSSGGRYRAGEGVFVLTEKELASLGLSAEECRLLRPYYPVGDITRYGLPERPRRYLLYLTARTAPALEELPRIGRHLARFRPLLELRREVRSGAVAWWHLHWPREERIFTEPRILCPQMGRVPQFVYVERPTFVGFSVNVVLGGSEGWNLWALAGVLNSRLARVWFERHAKPRGVAFDIGGTLLRRFPLPLRDAESEGELCRCVEARHQVAGGEESETWIEAEIDAIVERMYGVRRGGD